MEAKRRALIVFEHRPSRGPFRLLASGYRHCFCLLQERNGWLLCDPLKDHLRLQMLPAFPLDFLRRHYLDRGRHIACGYGYSQCTPRGGWLAPCTCVELVKRALGLHARLVLTPRQLFDWLARKAEWTVEKATDGIDIEQK